MSVISNTIFYAAWDKQSGKFIEWVTSTGRVSLRKNPLLANYFARRQDAEKWLSAQPIDQSQYEIRAFERVSKL